MRERLSGGGGVGVALLLFLLDRAGLELPMWLLVVGFVIAVVLILNALRPRRGKGRRPLEPLLERDDNSPKNERWWNIEVSNPNSAPMQQCYGKVRNYRVLRSSGHGGRPLLPKRGTKLPWRASPLGRRRLSADIAGGSKDYLDLAFCRENEQVYYTPQLTPNHAAQPLIGLFPLPPGEYEAEIEIGAEGDEIPLRLMTIEVKYRGGLRLEARATSS